MSKALILGFALLAQTRTDPDLFPLALHRSMEIDDLDRELQRLGDTILLKRSQLATTQRLAQRGAASRSDIERDLAALHYEEAHEAETRAFREIKVYERDVHGRTQAEDELKAFGLILARIKAQEAMEQVNVDYRSYLLKQSQALYQRKAVNRQDLQEAELNYDMAVASVALSQSRQAQVMMELAARRGEKKYDAGEYERLKEAYFRARIRYFEISADAAHRRFDIAQERSRRGLIPPGEIPLFQKSVDDADAILNAERKKLEKPEPPAPPRPAESPEPPATPTTLQHD